MAAKVKHVKLTIHRDVLRRIQSRSKSELQAFAWCVLRTKTEPRTPIFSGDLRRSADIKIVGGPVTEVWWLWTKEYAHLVEDMRKRGAAPRTPGTIAPFAVPTIREAIEQEIDKPIGRAFGGNK